MNMRLELVRTEYKHIK